jgi:hypothetical protein
MSLFDYSSSDDEYDMNEDEDIAMILLLYKKKRPEHGGSVFGRERIRRLRIDGQNKLTLNYLFSNSVYLE